MRASASRCSAGTSSRLTYLTVGVAAICMATSRAKVTKSSFLATKSVLQSTSISTPTLDPACTYASTVPSVAARSPRSWIFFPCLTRRISIAFSMSPSASVRAFLQSIIPAPVRSRRAFTSFAPISTGLMWRSSPVSSAQPPVPVPMGPVRERSPRACPAQRRARRFLRPSPAGPRSVGAFGPRFVGCGFLGSRFLLGLLLRLLLGLALGLLLSFALGAGLGLDAGLLFGFLASAFLLAAEDRVALGDDLSDRLCDQRAGADRVVVARDHEVDAVGVAVGVDQGADRDAQAPGLFERDRRGLGVHPEHGVGHALHVLHAPEVAAQLLQIGLRGHPLAGRQQGELALGLEAFEVVQPADTQADRLEVRQQATEPAVVHERHVGRFGDLLDGVAGLLLGAHEQHRSAAVGHGPGELLGLGEQALSLEQVDDVDAAALTEYEAAHLGVPAARLMAEVNAGLQQLRDAYVSHGLLPCMYAIEFRVDGADPEPARESLLRAG